MERKYSIWQLRFCHPKYLGVWLFIGFLYLCAWLPWRVQLCIGALIGKFLFRLAKRRRRITETNVRLCFPELSAIEQAKLVKKIFISNAIGYMETGIAWFRKPSAYEKKVEIIGLEHIQNTQASGKGVILAGAHFAILDLAGALSARFFELNVTYRPLNNALLNEIMMQGRQKFCSQAIHKKNVEGFIQLLKDKKILWYPPDQDYGRKHSVFATFFNQPAATVTGLSWLAESGNAKVIPYAYFRKADRSGWVLKAYPALNIPSGNELADAQAYNDWLTQEVRKIPEQYLWFHKRFKTREDPSEQSPYDP